jgi:hypothetical protein
MSGSALDKIGTRLIQAELAVDGEADFRGIGVFLSVILPPADRA